MQHKDIRSEKYYSVTFNGGQTPKLNALLCAFQGLINTAAVLLPLDTDTASVQTIAKLQYLTIYHLLQSLRKLSKPGGPPLTARSRDHISKILEHSAVATLFGKDSRPLRNSLMHYDVDSRIDLSKLSLNHPLYKLPEACLAMTTSDFTRELNGFVALTADEMNTWAALR